jgi:hypothetical protein
MKTQAHATDLHRCLGCSAPFVQPVEWEPSGPDSWRVLLHCPDCDLYRAGDFEQATLDEFERELDRGEALLRAAYGQLVQENVAAEIDRFAHALAVDALLPEDF